MTTLAQQAHAAKARSERHSEVELAAYERRRAWSRTDTARWLNEHGEAVLAQLRRRGLESPSFTKRVGFWLKETARDRGVFDRAHGRLASLDDSTRSVAIVPEVLR